MADDTDERFEEQLRSLISEETEGGETTMFINRSQVEDIGKGLDMSPRQACTQFFALQGFVWDVVDMDYSMIDSSESRALPPPRNWDAINDVYLAD
jgi:hypothetical protein